MPLGLFSLPVELRLHIYGFALISRGSLHPRQMFVDGDKRHIQFDLEHSKPGRIRCTTDRRISPALLQTCRVIHLEASPILYSGNNFFLGRPEVAITFLETIGSLNVRNLRSARISIWYNLGHPLDLWLEVFDKLAQNATRLREIVITFGRNRQIPGDCGAGDSLDFGPAIAKIQGLKRLEVWGLYAQHWPAYWEEKMGIPVHERPFHKRPSKNGGQ